MSDTKSITVKCSYCKLNGKDVKCEKKVFVTHMKKKHEEEFNERRGDKKHFKTKEGVDYEYADERLSVNH